MYSDTCGPFSVADANNKHYFQKFIDDYTRLTMTFIMRAKTQKMGHIERYTPFMKNKFYAV